MINKLKQSLILYFFLFQNIIGTDTNIEFWINTEKNVYKKLDNYGFKINLNDLKNTNYNEEAVKEQINYLIYMNGYQNFYKDIFSEKTLNKELVFFLKNYIDNKIGDNYYITNINILTSKYSQIYDLQNENLENIIKQINKINVCISNSKEEYNFDDDSKEYIKNYDKYFHSENLSEEQKFILEFIKSAIGKGIYYSINHNYERLKKIGLSAKQKNKNNIHEGFKIIPHYDINDNKGNNLRNIKLCFGEECFEIKINTYTKASIFLKNFKAENNDKILNNIIYNYKYYTLVNENNENLCYYRIPNDNFTHNKVVNKDDLIQPEMKIELNKVQLSLLQYNGKNYNKVANDTTVDIEDLFKTVREIIDNDNKKNFKIKYINFDSGWNYLNTNNIELKDMPNTINDFIETIKKELKPYVYIVLIAKTEEEKQKEQEEDEKKKKIDKSDLFSELDLYNQDIKNKNLENSKNDMFNNDVNDNKNIKNNINLNNIQNINNNNEKKIKHNPIMNNNINRKNIKEKLIENKPIVNNTNKTDSINTQNSKSSQKDNINNNDSGYKCRCSCR